MDPIAISVFIILFVAVSITVSISFLIRCLRARPLLPPSLSSLIRRLCGGARSQLFEINEYFWWLATV
ncbi:hypothetical protein Bca4012_096538 [Brassica carinata]|uniref:Uncharacterized protein n=1 Tax=Brassica cretica TaxID=69181 RepID=A0A8S9RCV1_BRACR|nr:hypothetical protein F2Q69_00063179 [Brassica cretica]